MDADGIEPCLLYLTVEGTTGAALDTMLTAALTQNVVTTVLFKPGPTGALTASDLKPLVNNLKAHDVIALVADDAELAKAVEADGVHLSWHETIVETYQTARTVLGHNAVIGADAGRSRHIAMELGEAGADYIAFGIPAHVKDRATAEQRQLELIAWWGEIFEPACVAFDTHAPDAIGQLVEAGADFIALPFPTGQTADDIRQFVQTQDALLEKHSTIRFANLGMDTETTS